MGFNKDVKIYVKMHNKEKPNPHGEAKFFSKNAGVTSTKPE